MLLFKKKFIDPIRRGEKTQTIRLWDRRRMKPGQRSYIPGIGYIAILLVEPVELDQLTDDDAVPDGFATAALLREELQSLYSEKIEQGFIPFRICFSVYPKQEQQRMREERKRIKHNQNEVRQRETKKKEFVDKTLAKLRHLSGQDS
ncbi:hypothetical protein FACS1894189_7280 [Planctomycetales bacterium]|nr:hypothetical protein FACS1894189_7280 [Planctomycetales bacterium]